MSGFTPVNVVELTNVSIVRLKKGGVRFELACYPNKVIAWRKGIETDLDQVLQAKTVFLNVKSGQIANDSDLTLGFPVSLSSNQTSTSSTPSSSSSSKKGRGKGNSKGNKKRQNNRTQQIPEEPEPEQSTQSKRSKGGSKRKANKRKGKSHRGNQTQQNTSSHLPFDEIIHTILNKGQLQFSPKERQLFQDNLFKDIVNIVISKTVNPENDHPIPAGIIERALKDMKFKVEIKKPAKVQAMEAIKHLIAKKNIPMSRANMRIRFTIPENISDTNPDIHTTLKELILSADLHSAQDSVDVSTSDIGEESSEGAGMVIWDALIIPKNFRPLNTLISKLSPHPIDVINVAVQNTSVSEASIGLSVS